MLTETVDRVPLGAVDAAERVGDDLDGAAADRDLDRVRAVRAVAGERIRRRSRRACGGSATRARSTTREGEGLGDRPVERRSEVAEGEVLAVAERESLHRSVVEDDDDAPAPSFANEKLRSATLEAVRAGVDEVEARDVGAEGRRADDRSELHVERRRAADVLALAPRSPRRGSCRRAEPGEESIDWPSQYSRTCLTVRAGRGR